MNIEDIKTLDMDQIEARKAEIASEIDNESADLTALNAEVDALEARAQEIKETAEVRSALTARVNAGAGTVIENGASAEISAEERSAQAFMEDGKMEVRALLSTGEIAKPTRVGGINGLGEVAEGIVDDVNAIALTGAGTWSVGYKKTDAVADDVTDGNEIGGTPATHGKVDINPAEWGVFDEISNQVKKMTTLDYQASITNSALIALRAKAADKIVAAVKASAIAQKTAYALDQDFLRSIVLGYRAIQGKGASVLYIGQEDLLTLGKVRGTNEKKPLYEIEFDNGTTTSGIIKEGGLAVKFRVLDQLAKGTQLFGQPLNIDMPMWDGYQVETDEGGEFFKKNMIGIRGLQTANADLVAYHGMVVNTQA